MSPQVKRLRLSPVQEATFKKMDNYKWYSAYDLQVRLSTMEALLNKGLVERSKLKPGDMFFPRTAITFRRVTS